MNRTSPENFVALIITHGRPDRVFTYNTLRRSGYTGPIKLLIDDLDPAKEQYYRLYGDEVLTFSKQQVAETFDEGDNFKTLRGVIYARNASFNVVKKLGYRYFIQLDDDYQIFVYRFDDELNYRVENVPIKNLDRVFSAMLKYFSSAGLTTLAMAQGGDFLGGEESNLASCLQIKRKCMNPFLCDTENPFTFVGRINEDVNTPVRFGSTGQLFFTTNQVSLGQMRTQSQSGGMTELYLDSGTYVKSFYSVMYHPSSVTVRPLMSRNPRLHHLVRWRNAVPMILRESHRKA